MVVLLLDDATDLCVNKADNYVIQVSFGNIILAYIDSLTNVQLRTRLTAYTYEVCLYYN